MTLSGRNGAQLVSSTLGNGYAGSVIIDARDRTEFEGSNSGALSSSGVRSSNGQVIVASGRGGDVHISTGTLSVRNGAQLDASTFGRGNAGSVIIEARDRVEFEGSGSGAFSRSGILSSNGQVVAASGRTGDVRISTGSLSARNGAELVSNTNGTGSAGSVIINARDRVEFRGQWKRCRQQFG